MRMHVADVEIGRVFDGRRHHLTLARALAFSGGPLDAPNWPEKNLHTDLAAANEAGLAAVVASGTQFEGYLISLLVELCGRAWVEEGELDVKITRSVKVGETVQAKAELTSRTSERGFLRVVFNVWCENQDGVKVLTGTATCVLPQANLSGAVGLSRFSGHFR